jgi:hypothetical protein
MTDASQAPRARWLHWMLLLPWLCASAESAETPELEFFRDGTSVTLSQACSAAVVADVLELFHMTGARSGRKMATLEAWVERSQGTYLHLAWRYPQRIAVRHSEEIEASELLVPLNNGSTDHLLARHGDQFWAFTKYNPRVYGELVCKPELRLDHFAEFCKWFDRVLR